MHYVLLFSDTVGIIHRLCINADDTMAAGLCTSMEVIVFSLQNRQVLQIIDRTTATADFCFATNNRLLIACGSSTKNAAHLIVYCISESSDGKAPAVCTIGSTIKLTALLGTQSQSFDGIIRSISMHNDRLVVAGNNKFTVISNYSQVWLIFKNYGRIYLWFDKCQTPPSMNE
jgi:hypothetical protein